jgi:hypothetical protein
VTAAIAGAAGFAQFGASSALADVAPSFGQPSTAGSSVVAQIGLSVTVLGIGLGIIRPPDGFERLRRGAGGTPGTPGRILGRPPSRRAARLWLVVTLIALLGLVTGPANAPCVRLLRERARAPEAGHRRDGGGSGHRRTGRAAGGTVGADR